MSDIDTSNRFFVGTQGDRVFVLAPPTRPMERHEALNLAAWLVALSGGRDEFPAVLEAVLDT